MKALLIVMACAFPKYTECVWVDTIKRPTMRQCYLDRPYAAAAYQLTLDDGWLTFTRCSSINENSKGYR